MKKRFIENFGVLLGCITLFLLGCGNDSVVTSRPRGPNGDFLPFGKTVLLNVETTGGFPCAGCYVGIPDTNQGFRENHGDSGSSLSLVDEAGETCLDFPDPNPFDTDCCDANGENCVLFTPCTDGELEHGNVMSFAMNVQDREGNISVVNVQCAGLSLGRSSTVTTSLPDPTA